MNNLKFLTGLETQALVSIDPCEDIHCGAGKECILNQLTNEATCQCIENCPYEPHPRRMVTSDWLI